MTRLVIIVILVMIGFGAQADQPATPLDRVEIRQGITESSKIGLWNPLSVTVLLGKIQSLDNQALVLLQQQEDGSQATKSISSDQVQRIQPVWHNDALQMAIKLHDQGQYADFLRTLGESTWTNVPQWQQFLILGKIVNARQSQKQWAQAGDSFIKLAGQSIPPLLYAEIPLCWTTPDTEISPSAQKWIQQDNETAQLIGASWLLLTSDSAQARQVLEGLQRSSTAHIQQLARAQLWRLTLAPDTLKQLPEWLRQRDRMLPPLALGPTQFIADRLTRTGHADLALGFWAQTLVLGQSNPEHERRTVLAIQSIIQQQGPSGQLDSLSLWLRQLNGDN